METTRHFVATVYLVNDGATALHEHDRLEIRLPPGGHVDRGELPHEAALREAREETGLEPTLLADGRRVASPTARSRGRATSCWRTSTSATATSATSTSTTSTTRLSSRAR